MKVYWKLFQYISQIKKEILLKALAGIVISVTYLGQAIGMSRVIQCVWQDRASSQIFLYIAGIAAAILLRSILVKKMESFNKVLGAKIKGKMRLSILKKIEELGPSYLNAERSGKITSMILDGIESLEPFYVNFIPQILVVLFSGILVFSYLFPMDAVSSRILLISMVVCILVPLVTVPLISRSVTDYWSGYSLLTSEYIDTVQGMTTLKTLNAEEKQGSVLLSHAQDFYRRSVRNTGISLVNSAIMVVLSSMIANISVVVCAYRYYQGNVAAGTVTAFLFLAVECARPMMDLNRFWHSSFLGLSVAKELFVLLDTRPNIMEREKPIDEKVQDRLLDLTLNHLSFSYEPGQKVLNDITIRIPFGTTAAIVGASGSGKSTLMKLLLRFYDTEEGNVQYAGEDIKDYSLAWLYRNTAAVFQESFLFYGTIEENLKIGNPEASQEEMIRAAKKANAHDFIMSLPEGYQTMTGERGVTLSGGERQRIALARALLKQAPILLLDEATSSVDSESEQLIQNAISEISGECTIIMIAHRLSTVYDADRIFVLDDGHLAEEGTHEELLRKDGIYSRLIRAQEEITNEL